MTESRMMEFDIRTCCTCGISMPLTIGHVEKLRETHATFYCPNGHSQWFPGETNEVKIRKLEERIQTCQNIRQEKEKKIDELNKKVTSYKMLFRREQKKKRVE